MTGICPICSQQSNGDSCPMCNQPDKTVYLKPIKRFTSEEWLTLYYVINFGTPRFMCSKCLSDFPSAVTPIRCPYGHLANEDPNRILIEREGYEQFAFPFSH